MKEISRVVDFKKKTAAKQLVFGEVYVPNDRDTDGNWMTADTIEKMAHAFLHDRHSGGAMLPQKTKEVEAESVAYAVCTYFGIDTSEYTFPYVTAWAGETDMKTLRGSLDTIRDTASMLIPRIEESCAGILRAEERKAEEKEQRREAR